MMVLNIWGLSLAVTCAVRVAATVASSAGQWMTMGSDMPGNSFSADARAVASRLQGRIRDADAAAGTDELRRLYKISWLPGQPALPVDFEQYGGEITVDKKNGRALFFYLVEPPRHEAAKKPLVLWLNGGPGCSSVGYGAMEEIGPFRVNSDGKTLSINEYAWNKEANMLYLEIPIGTGFSYSNTSSDYDNSGDESAVDDAYVSILQLFKIFPELKDRPFFIAGESYAGHYVPQLAETILLLNSHYNKTVINLQGIMVGNPYLDNVLNEKGRADYYRSHGIMSEEVFKNIIRNCYSDDSNVMACKGAWDDFHPGHIDPYNIYAPICIAKPDGYGYYPSSRFYGYDPCTDEYTVRYLNDAAVQSALHARRMTNWSLCVNLTVKDAPVSMVTTIKWLISEGLPVWLYSGDFDSVCPIQATQYSIKELGLTVTTPLRPWTVNKEVAGYIQQYEGGFTFATVREAGHDVPSYQPERALVIFKFFLKGELPPNIQE